MMYRVLLGVAAAILLVTRVLHAMGLPMLFEDPDGRVLGMWKQQA